MSPEIEKYLWLLEQRLDLLRALAQQLVRCRKEFVAMDLDGMYARIGEQEDLCRRIQSLDPSIELLQRTCAQQMVLAESDATDKAGNFAWTEKLRGVTRELGKVQAEVGRLNQIHAAFLRHSGLTVTMFMNFLENYSLTYARPAETFRPAPRLAEKG
jgi:hypothetical protein